MDNAKTMVEPIIGETKKRIDSTSIESLRYYLPKISCQYRIEHARVWCQIEILQITKHIICTFKLHGTQRLRANIYGWKNKRCICEK